MKQANEAIVAELNARPFRLAGPRPADAIAFAVKCKVGEDFKIDGVLPWWCADGTSWDIGCTDCLSEFAEGYDECLEAEWIREGEEFEGCAFCGN